MTIENVFFYLIFTPADLVFGFLIFVYIYIYICYIYICYHENNVSPGYDHNGVMATHASCAQVHELPQSHCGDNQEGTLFS